MDYENGSYVITARKEFHCELCREKILPKEVYFARVKVIEQDKIKEYKRYHLFCANCLTNLTEEERKLMKNKSNIDKAQKILGDAIDTMLTGYEFRGHLAFFRYNVNGLQNFIVLPKNNKAFILSLATGKSIPRWLQLKFEFIRYFNGDVYYEIESVKNVEMILQKHISKC